MVKKKISKKHSNSLKRRNIILIFIGIIFVAVIIVFTVNTIKQDQLDRKDREKFTLLEARMGELKSRLDKEANVGKWKLEKSCEKPGIKFYTGEAGYCRITVAPQDGDAQPSYQNIKNAITGVGHIDSEGYDKVAEKNYIGFTFLTSGDVCGGYFVKNTDKTVENVQFTCGRPALHMYYTERN